MTEFIRMLEEVFNSRRTEFRSDLRLGELVIYYTERGKCPCCPGHFYAHSRVCKLGSHPAFTPFAYYQHTA